MKFVSTMQSAGFRSIVSIGAIIMLFVALESPTITLAADPDLPATVSRPLRYTPDGTDFIIHNGELTFNRPLYGPNSPFRTDGGDKPEFALLETASKDGVLRLGLTSPKGSKWLVDAADITTRYHPGSIIYEIKDPLLGDAVLHLVAISMSDADGLILRAQTSGGAPQADLFCVFGGVGLIKRPAARVVAGDVITAQNVSSVRAIDINGGKEIKDQLMLKPDQCSDNQVTIDQMNFAIKNGADAVTGQFAPGGKLSIGDAGKLDSIENLLSSKVSGTPLIIGRAALTQPIFFSVARDNPKNPTESTKAIAEDPAKHFAAAEAHRDAIAQTVIINTPDVFINAIPQAMCIAADACWQSPEWMHGAVSWRVPLLGWRGSYAGDALGWHDRATAYYTYWAGKQNTSNDFPTVAVPNPARGLAENDGGMLHSNGSIPSTHYDMNLVFIDSLFRHFLWTGDLEFAKQMWPVIQRHLAWEKRCFYRDGLYEAYAAIWASDALQYNGGGAAHSSAYNYYHNTMAARIASAIGEDPTPYQAEADHIKKAMDAQLWMSDRGWYAEYKDVLAEQQLHPSAAIWTIYHSIDSLVPDPFQAYQCTRYVDTHIAKIPVRGPGVPEGEYHVLPESDWMPYEWSLNNVVTGENAHMALAFWQAGRGDEGFNLFKSQFLDTMYLGLTPGNIPNLSAYDVYRGESYTDFDDPIGISSRAMIEGLFGINPDALAGELRIKPGFPMAWDHASISIHDLSYGFQRQGQSETWTIEPKFPKQMKLRLQLPARAASIAALRINGQDAKWTMLDQSIGQPWIEILSPTAADKYVVTVQWKGDAPAVATNQPIVASDRLQVSFGSAKLLDVFDPQKSLTDVRRDVSSLSANAQGFGHHTAFAKVSQGDLTWWLPIDFENRSSLQVVQANSDADHFRFRLRNNDGMPVTESAKITFDGQTIEQKLNIPPMTESAEIVLPTTASLPGTTNVSIATANGGLTTELTDWNIVAKNAKFETVDLSGVFNDKVTQIFKNEYLSPRPTTCSLQMPLHGIGDWTGPTRTYNVDDSGLRKSAGKEGIITLPQGIPFKTPGDANAKNIGYTSQWDNYPRTLSVPLTGSASHAYFLLAGSTDPMQSQLDNGEVTITYTDGSTTKLALHNPTNWWPIDKNYRIDDYAFARPGPVPLRVELRSGRAYLPEREQMAAGGSANVLDLPLDSQKQLKSFTLHTESYGVVIGVMSITLQR